jgi:L-seryl-tRNA(Ser) seleniumtransferase
MNIYKQIPKVDKILELPDTVVLMEKYGKIIVKTFINKILDEYRKKISIGEIEEIKIEDILNKLNFSLKAYFSPKLKKLINGTGIILHTNFGRAPLSSKVLNNIEKIAGSYSNLEFDISSGKRGIRYQNIVRYFKDLTGAEDVLIVNNNAAAVLLVLSALACNREVIVSRGELVEIGGSFRIPEVMQQSGAILKEVGATNKTHLRDYINAINENTALLFKAHTSNYRIIGFSQSVDIEEIVEIGKRRGIPVVFDLGSGSIVDLSKYGLPDEPVVTDVVNKEVDIVTFSGDKLFGGPQAGIILGRKKYIDILKKHPLNRALRIDKFTLAALESVVKEYFNVENAFKNVLSLRLITEDISVLKKKGLKLRRAIKNSNIKSKLKEDYSYVGGGSFPMNKISTLVLELIHSNYSANEIDLKLKEGELPVIGRIKNDTYMLDLRTIFENQIQELANAINSKLI